MKKLFLLFPESRVLQHRALTRRVLTRRVMLTRNSFLIYSFILHMAVFTLLSYSPVVTSVSTPTYELDMINAVPEVEQADEVKVEPRPQEIPEEAEPEPVAMEQKAVPLTPAAATIYLPIFEVNVMPKIKKLVEPVYPAEARQAGIEASVIVEIDIDEQGIVDDARVVRSAGFGFDEAARMAIKQSRFSPALKRGKPVPVRVRLPIKFELE